MGQPENNLRIKTTNSLTTWQRLWRVNCGMAWASNNIEKGRGFIKLWSPRVFYGMPAGTPDLIGFESIVITDDMVGKRICVAVGSELKATKGDKLKPNHINELNLWLSNRIKERNQ